MRAVFTLGQEYFFYGRYEDAINMLKRHLALPNSIWDTERVASMRYIAKSYAGLGDNESAKA